MSVLRDNRSPPTVVHAHRDQIDVLRHAVGPHQSACSSNNRDKTGRVKPKGPVPHKQVIVFDAERPIRRKAKLKSGTDRSTPPAFGRSGAYGTADARDSFVNIARHSGAALDVEEDVAPSIPDLSGEQTESVDLGTVCNVSGSAQKNHVVYLGAAKIRPIA